MRNGSSSDCDLKFGVNEENIKITDSVLSRMMDNTDFDIGEVDIGATDFRKMLQQLGAGKISYAKLRTE